MKRIYIKIVVFYLGIIVVLSGCSKSKKEEEETFHSVASNGIEITKIPEGCEVIENTEDFYQVKENQDYNEDTDCNNGVLDSVSMDTAGTMVYYIQNGSIYCFDKASKDLDILCGKPDCNHDTSDCNAYIQNWHGIDIDIYKGKIYTVVLNDTNENITLDLIEISSDGSERKKIETLTSMQKKANDNSIAIRWILHRGYIYYVYDMGNGYTEDAYYLNGSSCIYRYPLDGSSKPECIMALDIGMDKNYIKLKAVGSYIYFIMPEISDAGLQGLLYRYNTESNKVECLNEAGYIADYTIIGQDIIFKNLEDPCQIWQYKRDSGSSIKLFETDSNIGICYNEVYADKNYIYNIYSNEEESIVIYAIYDYEGNYIGRFEREWSCQSMGMDADNFYFKQETDDLSAGIKFYYLSKEKIHNGTAEMILVE